MTQPARGAATPPAFKMKADLKVLGRLGISLYSHIAVVPTEALANAWDAAADDVKGSVERKLLPEPASPATWKQL
jgi:hypothetical protein